MTGEKLFESIGGIDDRYIEEAAEETAGQPGVFSLESESNAEIIKTRENQTGVNSAGLEDININEKADGIKSVTDKRMRISRLANIAACFICLICAAGIGAFSVLGSGTDGINENWYSFMKNGSYDYLFVDDADQAAIIFSQYGEDRDGGGDVDGSWYKAADSVAECPYEYSRSFDEKRMKLESENKIPVLEEYRRFYCTVAYLKDDSVYSVEMNWWKGNAGEQQSSIELTAAYHEIDDFSYCVAEMQDEYGNVIKPKETVVNGVTIKSEGGNGLPRSLSFSKDGIWYRLSSADDSNDDLGKVLDWVWNNGIDFEGAFAAENGDKLEYDSFKAEDIEEYDNWRTVKSSAFYDEIPADFAACLPKFDELGWKPIKCDITLKNGKTDIVECTYDYGGDMRTIWTVSRINSSADELNLDLYTVQGSEYDLGELSELLFFGAEQKGKKTEGYKRLERAVNSEQGLILGFSIGKNDGYRFVEYGNKAVLNDNAKYPEGMDVKEGNPGYRPDGYYYVAFTTGSLTAEQIWQALNTVYSNLR